MTNLLRTASAGREMDQVLPRSRVQLLTGKPYTVVFFAQVPVWSLKKNFHLKDECQGHVLCACIVIFTQIHTGRLQQIAIKIFSLVYLHFGKLQSNTFTERIAKISTDQKTTTGKGGFPNSAFLCRARDLVFHFIPCTWKLRRQKKLMEIRLKSPIKWLPIQMWARSALP